MVFRRRDRRPVLRTIAEFVYPRGGWARAYEYVKLRLRRLPGTPERIARGIWAGIFVSFTPFYGLHMLAAALLAVVMRGNVLAALLATFFGNPLTYVPIAIFSLQLGHFMLGTELRGQVDRGFFGKFYDAGADLWYNFMAIFTKAKADWTGLARFNDDIFLPWLVGGLIPGILTATIMYWLAVPVIRAYQNRRKGRIKQKFEELKAKASRKSKEG